MGVFQNYCLFWAEMGPLKRNLLQHQMGPVLPMSKSRHSDPIALNDFIVCLYLQIFTVFSDVFLHALFL